jgi:hypothetical protein
MRFLTFYWFWLAGHWCTQPPLFILNGLTFRVIFNGLRELTALASLGLALYSFRFARLSRT